MRVATSLPIALSVYNAGPATHELDSLVLLYAAKIPIPPPKSDSSGILLPQGQSIRIAMAHQPGTYRYICRPKGHANMTGTLIVE
jgi:plastocyanin